MTGHPTTVREAYADCERIARHAFDDLVWGPSGMKAAEQIADAIAARAASLPKSDMQIATDSASETNRHAADARESDAVALLREVQWADRHHCPVCSGSSPEWFQEPSGGIPSWAGHKPDCCLTAILSAQPPGDIEDRIDNGLAKTCGDYRPDPKTSDA